jgi:HlyD family secretion protein
MGTPAGGSGSVAERLGLGQSAAGPRRFKRWQVWAAAALVMAIVAIIWLATRGTPAAEYSTQLVERGDITVTVNATGSLAPTNQVEVGSELSGIVTAVTVDIDDRVTMGQVLARLDTAKLASQAMQSGASLEAARAQLLQRDATAEEARAQLARLEEVHRTSEGRVPSQQELDAQRASAKRADADRANARAAVSQAEAALRTIRTDLAKMVIRSPTNGVVLTRTVDPGQTVAASFQAPVLFTIAEDLTKMELTVNVDEADVGQVRTGQKATFTVDAYPERVFEAQVAKVRYSSETVSGVVTYPTILYVDNPDLLLRPGMTATAEIVVERVTNALLVPNAALRFTPAVEAAPSPSGGGTVIGRLMPRPQRRSGMPSEAAPTGTVRRVWVVRDGAPVAIEIETGVTNGIMTAVVSGELEVGTPVIIDAVGRGKS